MDAFILGVIVERKVIAPKVSLDGGEDDCKYVAQARHRDEEDEDKPRDLVAADVADCRGNRVTFRHFTVFSQARVHCALRA